MSYKIDYDYHITSINHLIKNIMSITPKNPLNEQGLNEVIAKLVDLKVKYQKLKDIEEESNV